VVTTYAAIPSQEVLIYVDQNGNTLSQETNYPCQATSTPSSSASVNVSVPAPSEAAPAVEDYDAPIVNAAVPIDSSSYELPSTTAPATPPATSSSTAPAPPTDDYPTGLGTCYAPYNDDGSCKTQNQVNADFDSLTDYSLVRIYGVDCNQVTTVLNVAKATNKKVFAGLFDINSLEPDLETIISAVSATNSDWSAFNTISVGNELVNSGTHPVSEVLNAIRTARTTLRSAGYTGPIVTVDTFNAIIANPELCQASDYCAANCHPFFDPNTDAEHAGDFVAEQVQSISDAVGGDKITVITETGWPTGGSANGMAIPSEANQKVAIESLKRTLKSGRESGLYLLSAIETKWKSDNGGTFGTEKFWGIGG
jgi:exo-beta-1,3-glucanase (GH17 family)